jgi:hypothetical protein
MEISVVRRRLSETIERARRRAADQRGKVDEATRAYATFLDTIAVPLFRQVANVLKVNGYAYSVFTPSGAVRLMSDRSSEDYIEMSLDTTGDEPQVMGKSSRARGRRIIEHEQPLSAATVADLTEEHVLQYLLKELEPFVDR